MDLILLIEGREGTYDSTSTHRELHQTDLAWHVNYADLLLNAFKIVNTIISVILDLQLILSSIWYNYTNYYHQINEGKFLKLAQI